MNKRKGTIIIDIEKSRFEIKPLSSLTLRDRLTFDLEHGDDLHERTKAIEEKKLKEEDKRIQLLEVYIDMIQRTCSFFGGVPLEEVMTINALDLQDLYEKHLKDYVTVKSVTERTQSIMIGDRLFWLPEDELTATANVKFVEFITAKELGRSFKDSPSDKLTTISYLCTIFLRPEGEEFSAKFIDPFSDRYELMLDIPLQFALQVAEWYDSWSIYIQKNFSVFEKSKGKKKGADMSPLIEKWGWLSFMNYVVQHGTIFYKSNGQSNLDNVKQANLYEVLIWASCEKDHADIMSIYYDNMDRSIKK